MREKECRRRKLQVGGRHYCVTGKSDAPSMQNLNLLISSRTELTVDSTPEGIGTGSTLDDVDAEPTVEQDQGSEIDENVEIFAMERRDFDDVDGIDSDIE
jgi:hypothetical protein